MTYGGGYISGRVLLLVRDFETGEKEHGELLGFERNRKMYGVRETWAATQMLDELPLTVNFVLLLWLNSKALAKDF